MATDTDDPRVADRTAAPPVKRGRRSGPVPGRRAALRRRRRRRQQLLWGVGSLVVAAAAVLGLVLLTIGRVGPDTATPGSPAGAPTEGAAAPLDPQPTLILATFDESDRAAGATQITVLAWDRETGAATALLVPVSTVADIPGHGLLQLGRALGFGQGPLLDATVDNLLGVDLDAVVGLSRQSWASLFARAGGLTVDIPEPLVARDADGSGRTRFAAGEQFLDGPRLAELLTFRVAGERELDTLPRTQLVLASLLGAIADDPAVLEEMFGDGAPMLEVSPEGLAVDQIGELFEGLAQAHADGSLVVRTLPVTPLGSGEDDSYRVDEERARPLIAEQFGRSVPVAGPATAGRTLEIRNGNGRPGAGQDVAQRLIPLGFRVVLTGNADRFDHRETRILVYDDDPAQVAIAEEIRAALGVGRIELSRVPQDIVDVTIVVGEDLASRDG